MGTDNLAMPALETSIVQWAAARPDIHALAVVGSYAQTDRPADPYSDLDLLLVVDDPGRYLDDAGWLDAIAHPRITFTEPTALGIERERRVLFDGGLEVDFVFLPATLLDQLLAAPPGAPLRVAVASVLARGCRVLFDRDGRLGRLVTELLGEPPPAPALPGPAAMDEFIQDFWYHAVWSARRLRRGELWAAHQCCDAYMKQLLLRMLEWNSWARDPQVDTWHGGRFLEQWADARTLTHLRSAFARYDESAIWLALFTTMDLFRSLAEETCTRLGYLYPTDADQYATRLVEKLARPR